MKEVGSLRHCIADSWKDVLFVYSVKNWNQIKWVRWRGLGLRQCNRNFLLVVSVLQVFGSLEFLNAKLNLTEIGTFILAKVTEDSENNRESTFCKN